MKPTIDEKTLAELADFVRKVNWHTRQWKVCDAKLCYAQGIELLEYGLTLKQTLSVLATILCAAQPDTESNRRRMKGLVRECKRRDER